MFKETLKEAPQFDPVTETVEKIVIDYANLSGRESANRAEFRERVRKHIEQLIAAL